jgi:RNA-directed DNA polymerase
MRICEAIRELTGRDQILLDQERVVAKLNRTMIGWANYFCLGPVNQAYRAVEGHARKRLRQWLRRKHSISWQATERFSDAVLHDEMGLVRLKRRISSSPWATS